MRPVYGLPLDAEVSPGKGCPPRTVPSIRSPPVRSRSRARMRCQNSGGKGLDLPALGGGEVRGGEWGGLCRSRSFRTCRTGDS